MCVMLCFCASLLYDVCFNYFLEEGRAQKFMSVLLSDGCALDTEDST